MPLRVPNRSLYIARKKAAGSDFRSWLRRHPPALGAGAKGLLAPIGPMPYTSVFEGLDSPGMSAGPAGGFTPPDTTGAIGPNYYVELVNSQIAVYSRTTLEPLAGESEDSFANASEVCDGQVRWDQQAARWEYAALHCPQSHGNSERLYFGWSKTSDPTDLSEGSWCKYELETGTALEDYPKLGGDDNFMIIGANGFEYPGGRETYVGSHVFTIPKPAVGDSSCPVASSLAVTEFTGLRGFTPVPANVFGSSPSGYVVATEHIEATGTGNRLYLMTVTGAGGSAHMEEAEVPVSTYAIPPSVPQPESSEEIDTSDSRLTQAVAVADPKLGEVGIWTQHTIAGFEGGPSVVRWYELQAGSASVAQEGTIEGFGGEFAFNAAISPTSAGTGAAIDYNVGGSERLVGLRAQSRAGAMPAGAMEQEVFLGESYATDDDLSCSGVSGGVRACRWGDYAGASPDPANAGVVWGSGQVDGPAPATAHESQWETYNFALSVGNPPTLYAPRNRTISPGAVVAFPGRLPATQSPGDGVAVTNGAGAPLPVEVMHWGAEGLIVRFLPSAPPGEYSLTLSDEEGSTTVAFVLTAPTDSRQTITPIGTGAAASLPLGVAKDQSGDLWFSDAASNSIGEMLPGGSIKEFPLLMANSGPTGIAIDQAGNVWVTDNTTGEVTELEVARASAGSSGGETNYKLASGATPDQVSVDPYGNVWVAEGDGVLGRISVPQAGGARTVQEWMVGCDLEGMVVDPFGNVWAVDECSGVDEIVPSQLGEPSTATQTTSGVYHVAGNGGTEQIAVAPNGDVWFTQWGPPVLGVIVPSPTSPTEDQAFTAAGYPLDGEAPSGIGVDAAGNAFVEDAAAQAVYEFSPASFEAGSAAVSGAWTEYRVGSWITNYAEGDEGNNLAVTPSGDVLFSGYVTNGSTFGTPYDAAEFVQGYIGTLPGVATPATSTGKRIEGGETTEEVVSGVSGDEVVIPPSTQVLTSGSTPFEGTIPPPVPDLSFVPSETAEFGTALAGSAFSVTPQLSNGDATHLTFSQPITIEFSFPLPKGVSPTEAEETKVYYYDPSSLEWVEAGADAGDPGGKVSVAGGEVTVTVLTYHLSSFALLAHAASAPAIASVSPNPASGGSTIAIDGSNLGSESGRVVLSQTGHEGGQSVELGLKSWSPTAVSAEIPSGQPDGTYTVAVVTKSGATTNSLALEVKAPVVPPSKPPEATGSGSGSTAGGTGGSSQAPGTGNTGQGTPKGGSIHTHKASSRRCKLVHVKVKHSKKKKVMRVCKKAGRKRHARSKRKRGR